METKNRIVCLMQYLQQNTDENHAVSTAEIRAEMARRGCPMIISTLRDDIEVLRRAGYDIQVNETEGRPTTYAWLDREWSLPELQILVDAVSSSQFITVGRSRELIEKLAGMAAPSLRESLRPQILVSEHIKAPNKQILFSIQSIRRAIDRDKKITFQYLQYNLEKKQEPRHAGSPEEYYVVSPYATIWNSDRYYLIGWSDKRQQLNTYRIDRMIGVKQIQRKRIPAPMNFNIQDYTNKVFRMYGGDEEKVKLRCKHRMMDHIIDKFGTAINVENIQEDTFDITVPVSVSGTFFAWVFQYSGDMWIVGPEKVTEAYKEHLNKAIRNLMCSGSE